MSKEDTDLVSRLKPEQEAVERFRLRCVSPNDAKYGKTSEPLADYISAEAEWKAFAKVQYALLQTSVEFGKAKEENLKELERALEKIDPLNMHLLEAEVTKHDQLAVIEEIGRFVSSETKALLHPGTTSYDIVDTARAYLFKNCWKEKTRPVVDETISQLCDLAEKCAEEEIIHAGRTHLQHTAPVPFSLTLSNYALRLATERDHLDNAFDDLRGKARGIVGTGAGIEVIFGPATAANFETKVLEKLGLEPDPTATQVTQKERLAHVGHYLTTLMHVLGDFADDIRYLYSSDVQEVTSRDNAERLGGSSNDPGKNNPINYENIAGKVPIVEGGMRVLYAMINTDQERDLRSSVQARYEPQQMMAEVFESFNRYRRVLKQLSINKDRMRQSLEGLRRYPAAAMSNILKGEKFVHSEYGDPHTFVKKMMIEAKKEGTSLLEQCLTDEEFKEVFENISIENKSIVDGDIENYIGSAYRTARENIKSARKIIGG